MSLDEQHISDFVAAAEGGRGGGFILLYSGNPIADAIGTFFVITTT